ncbi:hypothetical protein ACFQ0K_16395 [Nocardioides caeni]|uniref:Uncharacterized protein n=1 Tax=Nocardioides caeni TaxID=574700 RepID=A0A4S8NHM4_9ACTN|nr:hypothetical protein [Nocardioides caeni]THV16098.1 hypothetical protein E9934_07130 [Nocardioides caeni]
MERLFTVREDGQVDAQLPSAGPLFNEALDDSISSLPPRGARGSGPSTYWVDVALKGLRQAELNNDERPFTYGNITLLRLVGDKVEARYDFADDDEEGDFVDVGDFVALLEEWGARIREQAAEALQPLPETYRRNPAMSFPV